MSQGVLMFAFDSGDLRYTDIALWSAGRIQRHLGLPVTLVTDRSFDSDCGLDRVVTCESPQLNGVKDQAPWKNLDRYRANQITPYQQTLLLDVDYVVCSNQLLTAFDCSEPVVSMRYAYDATARRDYQDLNWFGKARMPSAWATVVYWQKSATADLVFDMMSMIQQNWTHYKNIYGIADRRFRNDYALAIASNTVMGHTGHWPSLPWNMAMVESDCKLSQIDDDVFEIHYQDQQSKLRKLVLDSVDFHALDKRQLGALIANQT